MTDKRARLKFNGLEMLKCRNLVHAQYRQHYVKIT